MEDRNASEGSESREKGRKGRQEERGSRKARAVDCLPCRLREREAGSPGTDESVVSWSRLCK
jgi:hypothetical protein